MKIEINESEQNVDETFLQDGLAAYGQHEAARDHQMAE